MNEHHDVIVLGAGMSGLVSASLLVEQGAGRILVIDEYDHVGGNHIDVTIGEFTFDVGSFIFQDDSPLLRHFPDLLDSYVPIDPTWSRLNPQGLVTQYPFSLRDDLLAAGPVEMLRILGSAVRARLGRRPMVSARDFAAHWIGPRFLHRSGLETYMARFCGCPIDQIDLAFAQSRMMWLPAQARFANLLRRAYEHVRGAGPEQPSNRQLARPRDGFTNLYAPAVRRLEDGGVTFLLGEQVESLGRDGDRFILRTQKRSCSAARLVSTIPITRVRQMCGVPLERELPSVTLVTLFYSFSGDRGFASSILYNFSHEATWKRLTVYSDFYGPVDDRSYFAVEVIAGKAETSARAAAGEFERHVAANRLFTGDLTLEGSHVLAQAYPIYTQGSAERAAEAVGELREMGIESFGRQGAFRYQPTARVSTIEAEAALRAM